MYKLISVLKTIIFIMLILSELNEAQEKNLNKAVFGYLPDWIYKTEQHQNIRYDLLTHLAVFPFTYDSAGNIQYPYLWEWNDVRANADQFDVKLIMTVAEFDSNKIRHLFTNTETKANFLSNLKNVMNEFQFEGVNIDFEHLYDEDEGAPVVNFMQELSDTIRSNFPQSEISFATPVINWNNDWHFADLAEVCDYLFVMGYGFYGEWSPVTGPVAPLTGLYNNLTTALTDDYSQIVNSDPQKIIYGFPYFGEKWITRTGAEGDSVIRYDDWAPYAYLDSLLENTEEMWSDYYNVSWYRWQENDTTWHQLWLDNANSLAKKFELVNEYNLRGLGLWALGYDFNSDELWDLIEEKFTSPDGIEEDREGIDENYILKNNYPNPFNPSTNIKFYLPEEGYTELVIFDVNGREVVTLLSQKLTAGWHKLNWDTRDNNGKKVASGSYIYQLSQGNVTIQNKMMLIK